MTSKDEFNDKQARDQKAADLFLGKRARAVRQKYDKALTRLWIGNAGGAVVTISYLGSGEASRHPSPGPLVFFLAGLIILGTGTVVDLLSDWSALRANQHSNGLLGFNRRIMESPLQRAGWKARNAFVAILSAFAFLGGCIFGLLVLT